MYKTHTCGELRRSHIGQTVKLAGWVHRYRDHGGLTFVDLRDRFGLVQVVADPNTSPEAHKLLSDAAQRVGDPGEGQVRRPPGWGREPKPGNRRNRGRSKRSSHILNPAKTPPFAINKEEEVDENTRLRYRYLDLRRERMRNNLILRHRVVKFIRDYLTDHGFIEVETPILFKTTPEGARDYLVPSRVHPGEFYALPQSPQQLKQLLMVAGVERYFQIARCFRDEDQRGDRQPEFTQLDLEMSFVEREDIMRWRKICSPNWLQRSSRTKHLLASPWPRLTYREAMERFGKDNPDLRYGLELKDVKDLVAGSGFKVFESVIAQGGDVRGLNAKGCAEYTRKQIDELTDFVKQFGAKGLAYIALPKKGELRSTFAKFLPRKRSRHADGTHGSRAGRSVAVRCRQACGGLRSRWHACEYCSASDWAWSTRMCWLFVG